LFSEFGDVDEVLTFLGECHGSSADFLSLLTCFLSLKLGKFSKVLNGRDNETRYSRRKILVVGEDSFSRAIERVDVTFLRFGNKGLGVMFTE
jgi:hypothetical protein